MSDWKCMQHFSHVFCNETNFSCLLRLIAFLFNTPTPSSSCPTCPWLTARKWLADTKCIGQAYMPCISQLAIIDLCFSPWWQLPEGGSASAAVWGQGRRSRQQAVILGFGCSCHRGLKAAALQGGSSVPTHCFRTWKLLCQQPFTVNLFPCFHCICWVMNIQWQSFVVSHSLSPMGSTRPRIIFLLRVRCD